MVPQPFGNLLTDKSISSLANLQFVPTMLLIFRTVFIVGSCSWILFTFSAFATCSASRHQQRNEQSHSQESGLQSILIH